MIWLELRFDGQAVDNIVVNHIDEALDIMENLRSASLRSLIPPLITRRL